MSLQIRQGEIFGILGPNGAGKTTFLNILSTLLLPDAGTVTILGIPSTPKNSRRLRSFLNMSSGYPNFPWCLSVEENLRFYGRLYGLSGRVLEQRIARLVKLLELERFAKVPFDELSSGTKQKLALAKAMINEPKIIFLDEPTLGLDPHVAVKMRETVLDIQRETQVTVLLTTHNMPEAEALCGRIAFIKDGRILKVASPAELKQFYHRENLEQIFIELAKTKTAGRPSWIPPRASPSWSLLAHVAPEKDSRSAGRAPFFSGGSRHGASGAWRFSAEFSFRRAQYFYIYGIALLAQREPGFRRPYGTILQLQENALAFILTGAITAGVLQVTQLDVAYGLLYEVWSKSLKQTLLTPVGITESLFGAWFNGILRGSVIFIALGLSAMALFKFTFPPLGPMLISLAGIFGCALFAGVFGQRAFADLWTKGGDPGMDVRVSVYAFKRNLLSPSPRCPRFFITWPSGSPSPISWEYLRQYFGFTSVFTQPLLKGTALIVIYLGLGLVLMRFAFHRARKKGIILRLSE